MIVEAKGSGRRSTPHPREHVLSANLSVRAPEDADVLVDDELATQEPFNPAFTYPIFGEQEKIFGYQNLDVKVCLCGPSPCLR